MAPSVSIVLGALQAALLILYFTCTTTTHDAFTLAEYNIFRDIMVMLLLGFGFLMTFLRLYGLSSVGLTLLVTVLAIQLNVLVEPLIRFLYKGNSSSSSGGVDFPIPVDMSNLMDGEFAAATALISFGAVIGRATPLQLVAMVVLQAFFYAINKVVIVLGVLGAEDVGGTITIHAFGAYFGLAVSRAFLSPKPFSLGNSKSNAVSDVLSLLGTTLLWVYWPSFVAATETASPTNTSRCIIHTVFSLLGSTVATFFLSHQLTTTAGTTNNGSIKRNFDPFHIANATLAGGVAAGASARLDMTLGGALLLGIVAGTVSVLGFAYISPMLEARLSMYDTCGVHNLHGLPSLVGAVASAIVVSLDSSASFLLFGPGHQALRQIAAIVCTVGLAVASGWLTGFLLVRVVDPEDPAAEYDDAAWWKSDYLVEALTPGNVIDLSHHSRLSVLPVTSVKPDGHD